MNDNSSSRIRRVLMIAVGATFLAVIALTVKFMLGKRSDGDQPAGSDLETATTPRPAPTSVKVPEAAGDERAVPASLLHLTGDAKAAENADRELTV